MTNCFWCGKAVEHGYNNKIFAWYSYCSPKCQAEHEASMGGNSSSGQTQQTQYVQQGPTKKQAEEIEWQQRVADALAWEKAYDSSPEGIKRAKEEKERDLKFKQLIVNGKDAFMGELDRMAEEQIERFGTSDDPSETAWMKKRHATWLEILKTRLDQKKSKLKSRFERWEKTGDMGQLKLDFITFTYDVSALRAGCMVRAMDPRRFKALIALAIIGGIVGWIAIHFSLAVLGILAAVGVIFVAEYLTTGKKIILNSGLLIIGAAFIPISIILAIGFRSFWVGLIGVIFGIAFAIHAADAKFTSSKLEERLVSGGLALIPVSIILGIMLHSFLVGIIGLVGVFALICFATSKKGYLLSLTQEEKLNHEQLDHRERQVLEFASDVIEERAKWPKEILRAWEDYKKAEYGTHGRLTQILRHYLNTDEVADFVIVGDYWVEKPAEETATDNQDASANPKEENEQEKYDGEGDDVDDEDYKDDEDEGVDDDDEDGEKNGRT